MKDQETLIVYKWGQAGFNPRWAVKDSKGNHIGTFNSQSAAEAWCRDNGYRSRIETSADVRKQQ